MSLIDTWEGKVEVNGTVYDNISAIPKPLVFTDSTVVTLYTDTKKSSETAEASTASGEYKVTVRAYMTKKATPSFDFMLKFNNDEPMPLRTMVGYYDRETKGMYHMVLHGDIVQERSQFCMCCGKPIDNPVSQYFGMGPVCGKHNYVNPFDTPEELHDAVQAYRKQLQSIKWTGWVIKSAIVEMELL